MEALKKLMEDHGGATAATNAASNPSLSLSEPDLDPTLSLQLQGGSLLLFGSIDWENATSKSCSGLETLQMISFDCAVQKTFSSSSSRHFFIYLHDHRLFGMGMNDLGQLGIRNSSTKITPVEIHQPWTLPIKKIATGRSHSLFLLESGEVYGCGSNACGQLGLGNVAESLIPILLPLSNVRDIACGFEHSLVCTDDGLLYAFGHPEYGQLGDGKTGEYIQVSQKVQYNYITRPKVVQTFLTKDHRGEITQTLTNEEVKIRCVAAGRNHSCAVEDWEDEHGNEKPNRVYSWGFGGYGRLGHSNAADEHLPREIVAVGPCGRPQMPQKQIRSAYCGSTYTLLLSRSNHVYFCGILPNSPRKEATTTARVQQELYDWKGHQLSGGSSWILVRSDEAAVFWGVPVAGTFGLGDIKRSSVPTLVTALSDMKVLDISSGYCHSCAVVTWDRNSAESETKSREFEQKIQSYPVITQSAEEEEEEEVTSKKKRGAPAKKGTQSKRGRKK